MYMCEKCKTKRKSAKQLSIYKYPQVLVSMPTLMVNRFSSDALFAFSVLRAAPSSSR
jgi:ubiquitin C-terminal hydrolase